MAAMKKVRSIILAVALAWVGACKHCSAAEATAEELFHQAVEADHKKQGDKAIALMQRVLQKDPDVTTAYIDLAIYIAKYKSDLDRAEKVIKRGLVLAPNDFGTQFAYAVILFEKKQYQQAKSVLIRSNAITSQQVDKRDKKLADIEKQIKLQRK
jgi:tetratricopeptide (TPR) repeat protein